MGLDFLKKKSEDMGHKSISSFLKINKYEDPQMALDLVAHICTSAADLSVEKEYESFQHTISSFSKNERFVEYYEDFKTILYSLLEDSQSQANDRWRYFIGGAIDYIVRDCEKILRDAASFQEESNAESTIKVAVCGGYSSGKSSFLNSVTGIGSVLPTGIEPVSMVNTYINMSDSIDALCVRGKNIKGDLVQLDRQVLDCIQHSSKSKVQVASVLNDLYIYVPTSDKNKNRAYLKDVTFIDTPGYNNSDNANPENAKSDKETALNAIENADVVFWCIDVEAGTIPKNDIDMLNSINDSKPLLIIFTKIDKKTESALGSIMSTAREICKSKLRCQPIDIVGFSQDKPDSIKSLNNNSLKSIIQQLTASANDKRSFEDEIKYIFDENIMACQEMIDQYEDRRLQLVSQKQDTLSDKANDNQVSDDLLESLQDMLLDNYDELSDAWNYLKDYYDKAIDGWSKSLDREIEWSQKVGFLRDTSSISARTTKGVDKFNNLITYFNNDEKVLPATYKREYREEVYEIIEQKCKDAADLADVVFDTDYLNEMIKNVVAVKKSLKAFCDDFLKVEREKFVSSFKKCYDSAEKAIRQRISKIRGVKNEQDADIFSAIANDNMQRFLSCFSAGVDLSKCNQGGYSPLTYTAKCGNNAMMKFFIDHSVDLSRKDDRGYNVLETAVSCHYRDICELLLKADKSLVAKSGSLVEVSRSNNFEKWISTI